MSVIKPTTHATTLLNKNISTYENSIDLDQMASEEATDQDLHCFVCRLQFHWCNFIIIIIIWIPGVKGRQCGAINIRNGKVDRTRDKKNIERKPKPF